MDATVTNFMPPTYDDVIAGFGIDIGGWVTDGVESQDEALHRLVQAWRLNAPHLRFLLEMMEAMQGRQRALDRDIHMMDAASRHAVADECKAAGYGTATYAGCVVLLLSGLLLRFKDDLGVGWTAWNGTGPLYAGHSFGQVITASANGFRHDDEWAQSRPAKPQQHAIQALLTTVLGHPSQAVPEPGRCPAVLDRLGGGRGFGGLTENLFAFASRVATRARAAAAR